MAAYVMVVYRRFGVAEAAWNPSNLEVHASVRPQCTGPDEVRRRPPTPTHVQFQDHKLVFRRYAHLYFIMCLDVGDNELAALEAIHLFVEILDHFFTSVTELDIVLNFHKV